MAAADFIKKLAPGAQKVQKKYNVLASLVIAQGCLESGFGSSGLSKQANNLFGIKGTYNGKYVLMWTSEQDKKGNVTRIQAKFRKYPSYAESLADLGSLYTRLSRYKAVVGEKDYKKATAAVSKAGYATDIHYPSKLNSIIEKYNLTKYDGETIPDVPEEPSEPETPTKPTYPSKEYQGKDVELNDGLPTDIDFRQLHVSTKDGKELVEIVGAVLELQDDTTGKKSFTFTLLRTEDNGTEFDLLVPGNILYLDEKVYNHQKYYITDIELDQSRKNVLQKKVTANHVYTVLLVNSRVEEKTSKKLNIKEALDIALADTPFQYVLKEKESSFDTVDQDGFGEKNRIELMDQIVDDYEIELDVNNYVIYVYKKMGRVVDYTFDSRYNMPGFKLKINDQNTSTRAWGYGAEKKDKKSDTKSTDSKTKEDEKEKEPEYEFEPILYIHPDEDEFLIEGKPRWGEPIRDDTVKKASNMVSALKKHVNPYPDVVVEAEYQYIYEPALQGIEEDFWKGDTIHVIADTANGITFEDDVRLVSVTYNPLNPYDSPKMTFANFRKDIQDYQVSQARQIKQQKRYIDQLMRTLN
ncbi:phage tail protein [Bacillus safensis]|uniref:phage tail protein n=1 Tax=Bacillus safensis TaxID=561879 RepID=UPI00227DF99F|nr:phage tail protein [Bacillus safensis]MCY7566149.1 phage tail protein [Bacillus safensis]MCY7625094.1 phage tail protein [Bacillus safensis]MCY7634764.1 phage tail protein [Bacillus safensis]MCY7648630.1 phage tail protein [Bacillus safensis]MCY7652263.1 phage tail protein [Bacillus safensis]